MSLGAEKLAAKALELPREHRGFLAEKLLESLECNDVIELSLRWKKREHPSVLAAG